MAVRIEAIAALANLAVNDHNEIEIVRYHGLDPIVNGLVIASDGLCNNNNNNRPIKSEKDLQLLEELATQCSRSIRNLSVNRKLILLLYCTLTFVSWLFIIISLMILSHYLDFARIIILLITFIIYHHNDNDDHHNHQLNNTK